MTWLCNKWHEQAIIVWQEDEPTEEDDGNVIRGRGEDVEIYVFIMDTGKVFTYEEDGRFAEDGFIFQVSRKELEDKSFEIITGRTHIEWDGYLYRVVKSIDFAEYTFTQLLECECVKLIELVRDS